MSPQQIQSASWRSRVKHWLQVVDQYRYRYGLDLKTAALHNQATFPGNATVLFVGQIVRGLAVVPVRWALRDGATALNVSVDDETLDFIANLAVDSALAT